MAGEAAQERNKCLHWGDGRKLGGFLGKVLNSDLDGILEMSRDMCIQKSARHTVVSGNLECSKEGSALIGIKLKSASGCVTAMRV